MKVLLTCFSAAAHSSFGTQTRDLWTRLAATGDYEIVQHGWFHKETIDGIVPPWQIIPTNQGYDDQGLLHNSAPDRYGEQSLGRVLKIFKPDLVWSLADPFMLFHLGTFRESMGFKTAIWCPLDGEPVAESFGAVFRECDLPLVVTKWAADLASFVTSKPVGYIYHGVDTAIFRMRTDDERKQLRTQMAEMTDIPEDALLLGWVGKNQFRKMPWIIYPLLYYLNSGHWTDCNRCMRITPGPYDRTRRKPLPLPDTCPRCGGENPTPGFPIKTRMWSHMYEKHGGVQFAYMGKVWNVADFITYTQELSQEKGVRTEQMSSLYSTMDIYVSLSGGEGFNIPLIEAASCGVPCIYTDYSGQAEVAEVVHGLPVEPACILTEHHTMVHVDRAIADLGSAISQIIEMATGSGGKIDLTKCRERGRLSRRAVETTFDWNVIVPQWQKAIKEMMERPEDARIIGGIA